MSVVVLQGLAAELGHQICETLNDYVLIIYCLLQINCLIESSFKSKAIFS